MNNHTCDKTAMYTGLYNGRAGILVWGVTRTPHGPRCAVFCMQCRIVLARDLTPVEARIFVTEYREAMHD